MTPGLLAEQNQKPENKHKTYADQAEELLARFPGVDREKLLKQMIAHYFFDFRFGNKREERAACDFLNDVQEYAAGQLESAKKTEPAVAIANPKS